MHRDAPRLLVTVLLRLGLLTLGAAPALAQDELIAHATLEQATVNPRTGEVRLDGTVTCLEWTLVDVWGELRQNLGVGQPCGPCSTPTG
jgi:hypothetical protein